MARSSGFALNFTLSDCGGRFAVADYCYPMLMGGAALIKAPTAVADGTTVNYSGLLADNLQASYYPDLVAGTSLGLLFPLLIHLTDISSGPIFPWTPRMTSAAKGKPAPEPPRPFAPSPYSTVSPGRVLRHQADSPWHQRPLDRFPCPRPVSGPTSQSPDPAYQWSDVTPAPTAPVPEPVDIRQSSSWSPEVLVAAGGDGKNRIRQSGGPRGDRLVARGGSGENQITQTGGWGSDKMVATLGDGPNGIQQRGGAGDDDQRARLGHGDNKVKQDGGWGDDRQIVIAGDGNNRIIQDGGRGDDIQRVLAGQGNNVITQAGGKGRDEQHISVGGGHNIIRQDGGQGDDIQRVRVQGDGNNSIYLDGGSGEDSQEVIIQGNGRNHVYVDGGSGDDVIRVRGGSGDDTILIQGGPGNDQIFYTVSAGQDVVDIDGGGQWLSKDSATIHVGEHSVTIVDGKGKLIYQQGKEAGTKITVRNIHELILVDAHGKLIDF